MHPRKRARRTEAVVSAFHLYKRLVSDIWRGKNSYDLELMAELAFELGAPTPDSIGNFIRDNNVSPEDFLKSFFKVGQPLVLMIRDILGTFERSGTRYGDLNLRIRFNFAKYQETEMNLNHFREWIETWKRVRIRSSTRLWSAQDVWRFCHTLQNANIVENREGIDDWLLEYEEFRRWPQTLPPQPRCNHDDLDRQIGQIWRLAGDLMNACRK